MTEIDTRPPEGVRNAARRGLALRREFGRGGTAVGVARARDLARGARLSPSTIKRMVSFFARHGSYAKDPDPSAPSTGYIAWMLWGGDAGKRWARSVAERIEKGDKSAKGKRRGQGRQGDRTGETGGGGRGRRRDFNESDVKRDAGGRFAPKAGGGGAGDKKRTPQPNKPQKPRLEDNPEYVEAKRIVQEAAHRRAIFDAQIEKLNNRIKEIDARLEPLDAQRRALEAKRLQLTGSPAGIPKPEDRPRVQELNREIGRLSSEASPIRRERDRLVLDVMKLSREASETTAVREARRKVDDMEYRQSLDDDRVARIEKLLPETESLTFREKDAIVHTTGLVQFKEQFPNANVTIDATDPTGRVSIKVQDKRTKAQMERRVTFNDDGTVEEVHNEFFALGSKAGSGTGTQIFSAQVAEARKMGVKRITATAGDNPRYEHGGQTYRLNGYYTWARLGYDAPLSEGMIAKYKAATGRKVKTVQDIMRQPDGAAWWKENGEGFKGVFSLSRNSRSIRALNRYKREKGIKAMGQTDDLPVSPFEFDEEDEALLDKIWAEIVAEDAANGITLDMSTMDEEDFTFPDEEPPLVMTKAADGQRLMLLITTNAYEDREGEIITRKALQADTDRRWRGGEFVEGDPVVFWHDDPVTQPERIIGDVIYANLHGNFLVEVAKERPTDFARKVWDFIEKGDRAWGASHGFRYFAEEKANGEYSFLQKFETSVLPLSAAANGYTFAGVIMPEHERSEREMLLEQILGEGTADMVNKKVAQRGKKLDKAGIRRKQYEEDEMEMAEEEKAMTPEQAADEIMSIVSAEMDTDAKRQALIDLLTALMGEADEEIDEEVVEGEAVKAFKAFTETQQAQAKALAEVEKRIAQLPAIIKALDTRFKAVERRLALTPRAASRAAETELTDPELLRRVKEQTKRIDPFWGVEVKGE